MKKRAVAVLLLLSVMSALFVFTPSYADEEPRNYTYYSQNGWGFTSGCLVASYAMLITNAGKSATPRDVYAANGNSVYVYHYDIARYFGYAFSRASLSGLTAAEKAGVMKALLESNPWGIIVGGAYNSSGSTHYIVARTDSSGELVFDDPAVGAGLPLSGVYRLNGENITTVFMISPDYDGDSWGQASYEVWQVNTASGVNIREAPEVTAARVGAYGNRVRFNIYEKAISGGYTWGRGDYGWCVLDFCVLANASEILNEGECGASLFWTLYSDGELVIKGSGDMTGYLPGGAPWYQARSEIKKISVFSGVQSIGDNAFEGSAASSVSLPNSVTFIGAGAFSGCAALASLTLPESLAALGEGAFSDCSLLTDCTVYSSACKIGEGAFGGGVALHSFDGSGCEEYAAENGNPFVSLGGCDHSGKALIAGKRAADCTHSGSSGNIICSVCGALITEGITLPALGHSYEITSSAAPDCISDGFEEYTCSFCADVRRDIIPAVGHIMKESVIPPTENTRGCTVHACVECGYCYTDSFTEPVSSVIDCGEALFSAFVSARCGESAHDLRFIFTVNLSGLGTLDYADVEIVFTLPDESTRSIASFIGQGEGGFTLYETVNAAGVSYGAAEGYALFGAVVGDIPYGGWTSVSLSVTDRGSGITLYSGNAACADVLPGLLTNTYGSLTEQPW